MPTAIPTAEADHLRKLLATDRRDLRALLLRAREYGPHKGRDQAILDLRGRISRNDRRLQVLEAMAGEAAHR